MNHFAYFCDAICLYDDAAVELDNLFQNIILSYKNTLKDQWRTFLQQNFPEKLQNKMKQRFKNL